MIDEIEEHLAEQGDVEVFGDGEEHGDGYVFVIGDAAEDVLLTAAARGRDCPACPVGCSPW